MSTCITSDLRLNDCGTKLMAVIAQICFMVWKFSHFALFSFYKILLFEIRQAEEDLSECFLWPRPGSHCEA